MCFDMCIDVEIDEYAYMLKMDTFLCSDRKCIFSMGISKCYEISYKLRKNIIFSKLYVLQWKIASGDDLLGCEICMIFSIYIYIYRLCILVKWTISCYTK